MSAHTKHTMTPKDRDRIAHPHPPAAEADAEAARQQQEEAAARQQQEQVTLSPGGAPSVAAATDGQAGSHLSDPAPLKPSDAAPDGAPLSLTDQAADAAAPIHTGAEGDLAHDAVTEGFVHALKAGEMLNPARLMDQADRASPSVEQIGEAVVLYVQGVKRPVSLNDLSAVLRHTDDKVREAVEACGRLTLTGESVALAA